MTLSIHTHSWDSAVFFIFHNMDSQQYNLFWNSDTWVMQLGFNTSPAAWQGSYIWLASALHFKGSCKPWSVSSLSHCNRSAMVSLHIWTANQRRLPSWGRVFRVFWKDVVWDVAFTKQAAAGVYLWVEYEGIALVLLVIALCFNSTGVGT